MANVTLSQAKAAKPHALERFRELGNVVGVGITRVRNNYAVKINLSEPIPRTTKVPTHVDGVPIRVEVVGILRPRLSGSDP